MSENTDTLIVAISEETGRLILARNGKYLRSLKLRQVEQKVMEYLHKEEPEKWDVLPPEPEREETSEVKA
jgi:hypothetical protein